MISIESEHYGKEDSHTKEISQVSWVSRQSNSMINQQHDMLHRGSASWHWRMVDHPDLMKHGIISNPSHCGAENTLKCIAGSVNIDELESKF